MRPENDSYWILILDGHTTYETINFMWKYYIEKMRLIYLPIYFSYLLQPLDLDIFLGLKTLY
jgi:hypothetical protein